MTETRILVICDKGKEIETLRALATEMEEEGDKYSFYDSKHGCAWVMEQEHPE